MVDLVLLAHAPLASAFAAVAAHTFPEAAARVRCVNVTPQEDVDTVVARLREVLPDGEVLILADVFGATPCNAALRVADGVHVRVVAGLNVPMLWRALCYADESLDRLVARAVDGGTQCVMQVSSPRPQNQAAQGPSSHDPRDHRHQQ
jgi:PTS system ascorbate-specific IIA component